MNSAADRKQLKIVLLIGGLFLCAAVLPSIPLSFFEALRFLVFGISIYAALRLRKEEAPLNYHFVPLAMLVTLFNPVLPAHLSYSLWLVIDLATAVYFLTLAKKL